MAPCSPQAAWFTSCRLVHRGEEVKDNHEKSRMGKLPRAIAQSHKIQTKIMLPQMRQTVKALYDGCQAKAKMSSLAGRGAAGFGR